MRKVVLKYAALMVLLTGFLSLGAQTHKAWLKAAETSFENKDYYSALSYYSEALLFERDIPTLIQAAESARLFDAYSTAEQYYAELLESEETSLPMAPFYLGQMRQRQGKYTSAIDAYNIFLSEQEEVEDKYLRIARKEIQACVWAQNELDHPKKNIEISRLNGNVNTPYSEFGAVKTETELYYSSLRFENVNSKHEPPRLYSRNLVRDFESIKLDSSLIDSDTLHVAHQTFNADMTKMYYTLCEYLNDKDVRCDLYVRDRNRNGSWNAGDKLPEHINTVGFTNTQPNLIYDESLEREILYFVSDKPGGKGGTDIWYTVIDPSGNYSLPMNLSGINTPENEFTPFFHTKTSTLYFSSDGYLGMGGYDIYKVFLGGDGWGDVINMGVPMNTSFHDVYFTLDEEGGEAYFSSNRTGSLYLEDQQEACCYDIHKADIVPSQIDLHAFTFDSKSGDSLKDVTLTVIDMGRGERIVFEEIHPLNSHFIVPIECEYEYKIIASKPGYKTAEIGLLAPECGSTVSIEKLLFLEPDEVALKVLTFDGLSKLALDGCTVRLFDLTTGDVKISEANGAGNDFYFDVIRTHRYEIIATKLGYTQAQEIFDVPENGPNEIVKELYLRPGLQDMLPIVLYFDNDRPDRRTYTRTTNKDYTETYLAYYPLRQTFIDKYAEAYVNVSGTRADVEMSNFFDNSVKSEYERFTLFLSLLEDELKAGRDYDIILKGYASPRASSSYNDRLGSRRINSVKNEFMRYNDGVLQPYIKNNLLRISEASIGEAEAPDDVSDDLEDEINSIYSPGASKERRVEIIDVKKVK